MKRYKQYKDSGVEWIGEIPKEWEVKRFGYMFLLGRGLNITKEDLKDEGIPCISYGEIHSKYGFEIIPEKHELKYVDRKYLEHNESSLLRYGYFVFADTSEDIKGSGNFTYLNSDIPVFAGYHSIIAQLRKRQHFRYIAYLFDALPFRAQIQCKVSGTKVFSITQTILKSTKLLLPSMDEQKMIVNFLDKKISSIDALIADKQKLINLLQEKRQAMISEAVTKGLDKNAKMKDSGVEWIGEIPEEWEIRKLKFLGKAIIGLTYSPEDITDEIGRGTLILRASNIQNGHIEYYDTVYVNKEIPDNLRTIQGDILISSRNSRKLVGKNALIKVEDENNSFGAFMTIFRSKYNPFIYYIFNSTMFRFLSGSFFTSTINQLTTGNLNNMIVPFPPQKVQREIVNYLDKKTSIIDTLMTDIQLQIEKLKQYRQSLISEVVTGKVAV